MRFLILLSALLAGLTGIIAGQPAFAHRDAQAAVASSTAAPAEQVGEIDFAAARPTSARTAEPILFLAWRLEPAVPPRGERRRE